ncbi:hypothetical protein [Paenibacillus sp. FSL R5-0486]|uniref:hypothetical protein n=1 Tax=Paenibacillus sp. FSL R5-0486 TaxID=2921645 RepID=UPI0030D7564B
MDLIFTARSRVQDNVEYTALNKHALKADVKVTSGNGSAEDPWQADIQIYNEGQNAWAGVIHVEMPLDKQNPRFFCLHLCMAATGAKHLRMFQMSSPG